MTTSHRGGAERSAETEESIKVLVADDQQVVRRGLVLLLDMIEGIEVVGAARDGAEALDLAERLRPDVVLMDLSMPVLDGVAATAELSRILPAVGVLILTTYVDDASVLPALAAGARGYLTKDADDEEIEAAICQVHRGRTWLDPAVQARLVSLVTGIHSADPSTTAAAGRATSSQPESGASGAESLTAREAEVLTLIAEGLTNAQICERLVISQATVKTHINRIFTKIGVSDRAQAVRYAFRHNLGGTT
ncbi:response regulator transcription factor [Streptomyces sp. NPDC001833]|uniref:response regulator transcription factor n=1 Tax=Streptomyces sp. NPDC001833 TaxID=3154658 RepID=UPI0033218E3C